METTERKLRKLALGGALLWAFSYIACLLIVKTYHPPMAVSLTLTIFLIMGFAWFLYNHIRRIAAMDELQRRIQLEATAVAFRINLLLTMVMSLLESVLKLQPGDFGFQELVPLYTFTYIGGLVWARKRYA
jgi:hypothetical protein